MGSGAIQRASGLRATSKAWIVCGHFIVVLQNSPFTAARHRGNVAVNFFIVLSGFMTQWALALRWRCHRPLGTVIT